MLTFKYLVKKSFKINILKPLIVTIPFVYQKQFQIFISVILFMKAQVDIDYVIESIRKRKE